MALLISLTIVLLDRIIVLLPERSNTLSALPISELKQNGCLTKYKKDTIPPVIERAKYSKTTNHIAVAPKPVENNDNMKPKKTKVRNFLQRRRRQSVNHSEEDNYSSEDEQNDNTEDDEDDVVEIDDSDEPDSDHGSRNGGYSSEKEDGLQDTEKADKEESTIFLSFEVNSGLVNGIEKDRSNVVDSKGSTAEEIPLATSIETNSDEKINDVLKFISENDGVLAVIKVLCDWLRSHPSVIMSFGSVSTALWSKLFKFVNWLPNDGEVTKYMELCVESVRELRCINVRPASEFEQKFPLVEDVFLRGVPSLTQAHTGLDFESYWSCSSISQAISRVLCIRSFTHSLIKLGLPNLVYDEERRMFSIEKAQPPPAPEDCHKRGTDKKHSGNDKNGGRETLMRNMAKLRIKDEMKSIEKVAWIPVYLVLDTNCLLRSSITLKRLLSRRKFILVVPSSVLDRLDRLKKDSVEAREAIRWLEVHLQAGNKYVRVQRSDETADVLSCNDDERIAMVLRDSADNREVIGVVECAAYFSRSATSSASTVACILTDSGFTYKHDFKKSYDENRAADNDDDDVKERRRKTNYKEIFTKLTEIAGLKGVSVENARAFLERWLKHESFGKRGTGRRRRNS